MDERALVRQRHPALRKQGLSPLWGDVLLHGRGTVGETVLHLLFLLDTPATRRIIHILVPWLAPQKTKDVGGIMVRALNASYLGQPYHGEVAMHFAIRVELPCYF